MTVRELRAWLETQDQDAEVEVVRHTSGCGYYDQGGNAHAETFTPELSTYTDFRGNRFVKPDSPCYEKHFLLLGEING